MLRLQATQLVGSLHNGKLAADNSYITVTHLMGSRSGAGLFFDWLEGFLGAARQPLCSADSLRGVLEQITATLPFCWGACSSLGNLRPFNFSWFFLMRSCLCCSYAFTMSESSRQVAPVKSTVHTRVLGHPIVFQQTQKQAFGARLLAVGDLVGYSVTGFTAQQT